MSDIFTPIIKTLWIGDALSELEQLALRSFLACGHEVQLFTYGPVKGVPDGVVLREAAAILPEASIFRYKHSNSVAGFANWFRYKMLFEEGGIWVDTDVICLKRFDFSAELVFGREEYQKFNNAVLGGEKGHPLFQLMMNQAASPNDFLPFDNGRDKRRKLKRRYLQGNHRGNLKWGEVGPLGLTRAIHYMKLEKFGLPYTAFYPVYPKCWDAIFDNTYPSPEKYFPESYAIHLWNEMFRSRASFDKNGQFPADSLIEALKRRYP